MRRKKTAGMRGGTYMNEGRKTTLEMAADVCLPVALYYVVSNIALYLLNLAVQFIAERFFAGGLTWVLDNASAIQVADNAVAMCIGFYVVRRQFLAETAAGGEPVLVAPRRVAAGWLREGMKQRKNDWHRFILPLISGAGAALALNFAAGLLDAASHDVVYDQVAGTQYAVPVWLGLIAYGIVSPIVEEGIFRGILYRKCRRCLGSAFPAALISALLFGFLHGNVVQGVYGFLMGLMLAWLYERYDSFLVPVLVHTASNVSVFLLSLAGVFASTKSAVTGCCICAFLSIFSMMFIIKSKITK